MVNPHDIPAGKMTRPYLEEWILFGICVANKPAQRTAHKLNDLLLSIPGTASAFEKVRYMVRSGCLRSKLETFGMGQYTRIERAFRSVVDLPLDKLTVELLETVPGIGPKTARMLMLYHKPELEIVPLDTHVLKFLKSLGHDVPSITPTGSKYLKLEQAFLKEARNRGLSPIQLDKQVWQTYAIK